MDYSPHSNLIAAGGESGALKALDVRKIGEQGWGSAEVMTSYVSHEDYISRVAFSESGELMTGGGLEDCTVKLWNLIDANPIDTVRVKGEVTALEYIAVGRFFVGIGQSSRDIDSCSTLSDSEVTQKEEEDMSPKAAVF